eukprot:COSAG01_NODE_24_length_37608_cov_19.303154_26_plen_207_part_00
MSTLNFSTRTDVTAVNLSQCGPLPRWKRPARLRHRIQAAARSARRPAPRRRRPPRSAADHLAQHPAPVSPGLAAALGVLGQQQVDQPGRGRCVSIFPDKNRRHIGKSQSTRPPQRTQRRRAAARRRSPGARAAAGGACGRSTRCDAHARTHARSQRPPSAAVFGSPCVVIESPCTQLPRHGDSTTASNFHAASSPQESIPAQHARG